MHTFCTSPTPLQAIDPAQFNVSTQYTPLSILHTHTHTFCTTNPTPLQAIDPAQFMC